jgi:GNAT superfamily N-acetyltransferase
MNSREIFMLILFIIILLYVLRKVYYTVKYPFWSKQPVNYSYNILRTSPKIINSDFHKKHSPYTDSTIKFEYSKELDIGAREIIVNFLRANFVDSENLIEYVPTVNSTFDVMTTGLVGLKLGCDKIIGTIFSRPLYCSINKEHFFLSYIDYLCVDKNARGNGIAPKLISTIYKEQYRRYNYDSCLFKRECVLLDSVEPLCKYLSYGFHIDNVKCNIKIDINHTNYNGLLILLKNFFELLEQKFECIILPEFNIENTNNYHVFSLLKASMLKCLFVFRKSYSKIYGENIIECICSYNSLSSDENFYQMFLICISKLDEKYFIIEDISDNGTIISKLIENNKKDIFRSNTAYYFYNYYSNPIASNSVFIVN